MIDNYLLKKDFVDCFRKIGINYGDCLIVHSSLKKFPFIIGGAKVVVDALLEVVGDDGTIVVPYQRVDNTEPSNWEFPSVDLESVNYIRENFPAFDINSSEDYKMGALIKNIRIRKDVVISKHPVFAFLAIGKMAKFICNHQNLDHPLGLMSPLEKLYNLKSKTLVIGLDYDVATIMHLGEYLSESKAICLENSMINVGDKDLRISYLTLDFDSDEFIKIGRIMEIKKMINKLNFKRCEIKLFNCQEAVDESKKFFENKLIYYK